VRGIISVLLTGICLTATGQGEARAGDKHWSLRPRTRPAVPRCADPSLAAWIRTPLDAFVLERLLKEGLRPAPEADRRSLIRRLSFDLTGLPPTPREVDAFLNDCSPDADERLVERLLASPHYGEQWGRHWLDVVRYAETEGFEYDRERPGAWRYRDYVIAAFNADKPYDVFVTEQLAGDELGGGREALIAAGFHRLGPVRRNAGNAEVASSRNEVLTERTDAIGAVFLGLTVGCARCHDHKFDAISQEDYYRLEAFLAATFEQDIILADAPTQMAWQAQTDKLQKEIKALQQAMTKVQGDERQRLEEKLTAARRRLPSPLPAISTVRHDESKRTAIHVLKRGNPDKKGARVGPRVLGALLPSTTPELPPEVKDPRTQLARWLTAPEHPLTARVWVNRVWQYHFGRGLVETPNDFGVNGRPPSHPALLDYLANEFVAGGQRLKPLQRLILLSSTYRQASRPSAREQAKDPTGRLLGHFPRRRLEAEEIRDAMLAVAGRLNRKAAGPSVTVPVKDDLVRLLYDPAQWTVTKDVREHDRRGVYLLAKRNLRLPFMETFDRPDLQTSCPRRESSTHALQALELLNGRTANRLAADFAERLRREAGPGPARQIERAYLLAAGRPPSAREKAVALRFLAGHPLGEFALAMFNLNAFLYVN
jgi:hypothetical protein